MPTDLAYQRRVNQAEYDADVRSDLRDILVAHRERSGLTVTEVAKTMGVNRKQVLDYEAGAVDPSLSFHQRYARTIGARIEIDVEADDAR